MVHSHEENETSPQERHNNDIDNIEHKPATKYSTFSFGIEILQKLKINIKTPQITHICFYYFKFKFKLPRTFPLKLIPHT